MSLLSRFLGGDEDDDVSQAVPAADAEATDDVSPDLDIDDALDLVRNSRRRQVIRHVWQRPDGETDIGELSEVIAAEENDCMVREVTGDQRKRVYVALYQNHLDKLNAVNVVDWEKERGTVEIGPNCDPLAEALDHLEARLWGGDA